MNKTVYIQTRHDGQILNQGCYTAYYGFTKLSYDIILFESFADFFNHHIKYNTVFVGGIDTLRFIMNHLGIQEPNIIQPHIALPDFIKRKMYETTIGDIKQWSIQQNFKPLFIKPLVGDKTFAGFVCKFPSMDLIKLKYFPDDFQLLVSEVVEFQSEFRAFIQDGKIIDCKNYTGNFWLRPNPHVIQEAIEAFKSPPKAYTLDWGIDMNGNTLLIEINDAFGVAPYGLDPVKYAMFLETRWNELSLQKNENQN